MRKLLITGEMRSGTTLLANLLNSQEKITIFRDFLHIERLQRRAHIPSFTTSLSVSVKKDLLCRFTQNNVQLNIDIQVESGDFDTLLDFYNLILEQIGKPEDILVGHKTTVAHRVVEELLLLQSDLKVLYMLRDPRDVVTSALVRFVGKSPIRFIESWRRAWKAVGALAGQPRFASRFMVVRYEDLLLETERTLVALADFLEYRFVELPNAMYDYGKHWSDNSSFGQLQGVLDSTPVGRWRERNPQVGRLVEVLLRSPIQAAGYKVKSESGTVEQAWAEWQRIAYLLFQRPLGK
jgi:hypothetical protein